jgi:cell division protein FtsB
VIGNAGPFGHWHYDDPHNEIAVLKAEVNDLQRKIAELERENERLRAELEGEWLAGFDAKWPDGD